MRIQPGINLRQEPNQLDIVDNFDTKSEQIKGKPTCGDQSAEASSTIGNKGGRKSGQRYRVRRQDVRFMKRGCGSKVQDNKSELPFAVGESSWQRF